MDTCILYNLISTNREEQTEILKKKKTIIGMFVKPFTTVEFIFVVPQMNSPFILMILLPTVLT